MFISLNCMLNLFVQSNSISIFEFQMKKSNTNNWWWKNLRPMS